MRKRDKPGSYRLLDRGGTVILSGVKLNGERVKIPGLSRQDASEIAAKLFPSPMADSVPLAVPGPWSAPAAPRSDLDDFFNDPTWKDSGVQPLRPEFRSALNDSMNVGQPPIATAASPIDAEKRAKQAKQAKSLMELAGVGWAAGSVWMGRQTCERFDKEPPSPNPKQVNDLADVTKETFAEWFGDREVKPWQMMFLLTIGIPISMVLQAKPRKSKELQAESPGLKSLP